MSEIPSSNIGHGIKTRHLSKALRMHGLNSKSRTEIPIKDKALVHNKLKNPIYYNNETVRGEKIKKKLCLIFNRQR